MAYRLEEETEADWWEVEALYDLCFAPGRTALSSYRLRDGVPTVAPLCLCLRDDDGTLAAVIRYWPALIGEEDVLLLGPIAVHPTRQGEGLGGLLIYESLAEARRLGWERVLLVGDAPYYSRFGFVRLEGVEMPPPTNPDRVLGLELKAGAWAGVRGRVAKARELFEGLARGAGGSDIQDMENALPMVLPDPDSDIADLARRYRRAGGPVVLIMTKLGGNFERQLSALPEGIKTRVGQATEAALAASWGVADLGARILPQPGRRGSMVAAVASGAAGGAGGLATSIAELPVTVTVILHAIRAEAVAAGYDPADPSVRADCLKVFAAGSPLSRDDGVDTSFLSARMTLTGPALQQLIQTVAPKLAAALSQKLAAQAVPVLGAATGAALNAAYLSYYRELAAIRFALRRLGESHGEAQVLEAFRIATTPPPVTKV